MLERDEVRLVATAMGLGDQIGNPEFVSSMLKEMEVILSRISLGFLLKMWRKCALSLLCCVKTEQDSLG